MGISYDSAEMWFGYQKDSSSETDGCITFMLRTMHRIYILQERCQKKLQTYTG